MTIYCLKRSLALLSFLFRRKWDSWRKNTTFFYPSALRGRPAIRIVLQYLSSEHRTCWVVTNQSLLKRFEARAHSWLCRSLITNHVKTAGISVARNLFRAWVGRREDCWRGLEIACLQTRMLGTLEKLLGKSLAFQLQMTEKCESEAE